jgi:asparagine synthase (glutamine-hydrolysing)
LSGGVDSSAIAALAQRASESPVTTFNIRFEEAAYDESAHAKKIASALGTAHREVTLTESMFGAQLDDALDSIDQPTFDAINTYFVSRAVREDGLTVALAGTGGDELFGGYASFVDLPRARAVTGRLPMMPAPLRRRLARIASRWSSESEIPPQERWGKLADVLDARGDMVALYQSSYALFSRDLGRQLSLEHGEREWGLDPTRAAELRAEIDGEPDLSAISRLELASFLGERLLRDTDAASMAVSLEVRVPLIDHVVVEALARVPEDRRYRPLRKKMLLRQLGGLDPSLFDRPKAGFELPLDRWCKRTLGPRLRETFSDVAHISRVGLDASAVGRVWRSFEAGEVYWSRVWSLYVLLTWCRKHQLVRA